MVLKAFWHMWSTEVLARVVLAVGAAMLGSLGLYFSSPFLATVAAIAVFF